MNNMNTIEIFTVANGYMAREHDRQYPEKLSNAPRYVFETFDGLVEWMKSNLEKPANPKP